MRRLDRWLPTYLMDALGRVRAGALRQGRTTHIMFLVCDHFEPRHAATRPEQPFERLQACHSGYARLQERCRSEIGMAPLHSWFYPPHHGNEHLASLAQMAFDGLGEVELHYHHDGDTSETLRRDLRATLQEYNRWGLLLEAGAPPRTRFGFIHGDWALGNSCGGRYCGVNDELDILREVGCWGDLTMPSGNEAQTRKINSLYYGRADKSRPKAHDSGPDVRVGTPPPASALFMMQGPLALNWRAPGHPRLENASLTSSNWGRPDRIPVWLHCNVHVQGRPEWLFVKLHTHGAIERDFDALFGEKALAMHRTLGTEFNDGVRFQLHYVTARQAYNIAKAAEAGLEGNPDQFLDYAVGRPTTYYYSLDARHVPRICREAGISLQEIEGDHVMRLRMRHPLLKELRGCLRSVETGSERLSFETADVSGQVLLETREHVEAAQVRLEGLELVNATETPGGTHFVLRATSTRSTMSFADAGVGKMDGVLLCF